MLVELNITTVLLLFCGGIIFSIIIGTIIIFLIRYFKRKFSADNEAIPANTMTTLNTLPNTLDTGRMNSNRMFPDKIISSDRNLQSKNSVLKKTMNTLSISGN